MSGRHVCRAISLLLSVGFVSANIWLCPPPLDVPHLRADGSYFCTDSGQGLSVDPRLQQCQNPSFQDCNFYIQCVERYFPECTGLDNYAVTFGQYYCERFKGNARLFTKKGKKWTAASQRCLQKSILPLLRLNPKLNCSQMTQRAFQTYENCFTTPEPNVSLCSLCADVLPVLYTLAIRAGPTWYRPNTMRQVLKDYFSSNTQCNAVEDCLLGVASHARDSNKFGRFRLVRISTNLTFSRDETTPTGCGQICVAERITETIFERVKPPKVIQRFVLDYESKTSRQLEIRVFITNIAFLNDSSSNADAHDDLDTYANRFISETNTASPLTVDGGESTQVGAVNCQDVDCDVPTSRIQELTTITPSKATHLVVWPILLATSLILCVM